MASEQIAVIGSGIAGLAAGWACARAGYAVTVFEADNRCGMDGHTVEVPTASGPISVDVPLRVANSTSWASFLALCREVGVSTYEVDTGLSFSTMSGETWLRTGRVWENAPLGLGSGMLRHLGPRAFGIGYSLFRLSRELDRHLDYGGAPELTLDQFMRAGRFDPFFYHRFVLPILSTICTCSTATLRAWPASQILGLLRPILRGARARRLQGGATSLVTALLVGVKARLGDRIAVVSPDTAGVTVLTAAGTHHRFDYVIVATQANKVNFLDPSCNRERSVLQRFAYERGELVTHSDTGFLPRNRSHWMPLNYIHPAGSGPSIWTVWLNRVEAGLRRESPLFQTWQPHVTPAAAAVRSSVAFERSVVTDDTTGALAALDRIHGEPGRRLFFCGSYAAAGVPSLETATRSAVSVSERLGARAEWIPRTELVAR